MPNMGEGIEKYVYRRTPEFAGGYSSECVYFEESLDYAPAGYEDEWQRLHFLPNAYGYGVMWMPVDFRGTPAVRIPE